jgi:lipopolysaccharide transport system permease protein
MIYPNIIAPSQSKLEADNGTDEWTRVIRGEQRWFDIDLSDLWGYRDLVYLFVRRDLVATYKQTILGPFWFLITPLFTSTVFIIVFSEIAQLPTDGAPPILFYLSGTICWGYFASCLGQTSNTFVSSAGIFGKVYFPRLVVPISIVISQMLKFALQLILFLIVLVIYLLKAGQARPNMLVLFLPLLVLQMAALGLGCGILVSSITTKYRDMTIVINFALQLWMYATPIVYPMSMVPEHYRILLAINPMVSIVEGFRMAFLGAGSLQPYQLVVGLMVTALMLLFGLMTFGRVEKTFMDTI